MQRGNPENKNIKISILFGFPPSLTICAYFVSLSFGRGNDEEKCLRKRLKRNVVFYLSFGCGNDEIFFWIAALHSQ
jgi:hypothetical protein